MQISEHPAKRILNEDRVMDREVRVKNVMQSLGIAAEKRIKERFHEWQERAAGRDITEILDIEKDVKPLADQCMD